MVRFPVVKSPLYLTKSWHCLDILLSPKKKKKKKKKEKEKKGYIYPGIYHYLRLRDRGDVTNLRGGPFCHLLIKQPITNPTKLGTCITPNSFTLVHQSCKLTVCVVTPSLANFPCGEAFKFLTLAQYLRYE